MRVILIFVILALLQLALIAAVSYAVYRYLQIRDDDE